MKYPKKYKGEKILLKFPVLEIAGKWYVHSLFKNGTTERSGIAFYEEACHCWRVCLAYNNRVGFKEKEVNKIIKKLYNVEETKKEKGRKKPKKKKGKKAKKNKP